MDRSQLRADVPISSASAGRAPDGRRTAKAARDHLLGVAVGAATRHYALVAVGADDPFPTILRQYLDWFSAAHPGEKWDGVIIVEERDGAVVAEYSDLAMADRFPVLLKESRRSWVNLAFVAFRHRRLVLSVEYRTQDGQPWPPSQMEVNFGGIPSGYRR